MLGESRFWCSDSCVWDVQEFFIKCFWTWDRTMCFLLPSLRLAWEVTPVTSSFFRRISPSEIKLFKQRSLPTIRYQPSIYIKDCTSSLSCWQQTETCKCHTKSIRWWRADTQAAMFYRPRLNYTREWSDDQSSKTSRQWRDAEGL